VLEELGTYCETMCAASQAEAAKEKKGDRTTAAA
jgi:hypothetical protein